MVFTHTDPPAKSCFQMEKPKRQEDINKDDYFKWPSVDYFQIETGLH